MLNILSIFKKLGLVFNIHGGIIFGPRYGATAATFNADFAAIRDKINTVIPAYDAFNLEPVNNVDVYCPNDKFAAGEATYGDYP